VRFWNWASQFAAQFNVDKLKMFDQVMPSLRSIKSGDNGLREWCDVTVGFRLPLAYTPEAMAQQLAAQFEVLGADEGCELTCFGHEQAYRASKDSPLARAFVDAMRVEKLRPAFKYKSGTADFNVVGPIWDCPQGMVAYGPGDSDLDHTPHEHVDIDEFERGVRVLSRVMQKVIGGDGD
jgi:LysW-gamma-L-lysine carboxypeptidase